jgi:hypothetical protein
MVFNDKLVFVSDVWSRTKTANQIMNSFWGAKWKKERNKKKRKEKLKQRA